MDINEIPNGGGIFDVPFRGKSFRVRKMTDSIHGHASLWSFYDEADVREAFWHPKENDVVIDIGAGFGSYSLTAGVLGAYVYAFEPNAICLALLKENIELNNLTLKIVPSPIGIWKERAIIKEDIYALNSANPDEFNVAPLDEIVEVMSINRVDWIKMDVESAELDVLIGAQDVIRKHKPKILIECHTFIKEDIDNACMQFLKELDLGYQFKLRPYHSVKHLFCEAK